MLLKRQRRRCTQTYQPLHRQLDADLRSRETNVKSLTIAHHRCYGPGHIAESQELTKQTVVTEIAARRQMACMWQVMSTLIAGNGCVG